MVPDIFSSLYMTSDKLERPALIYKSAELSEPTSLATLLVEPSYVT